MRAALALAALLGVAAPAAAQAPAGEPPHGEVPPPGGIVPPLRFYELGLGAGSLAWDDAAPYDDATLAVLTIERRLWSFVRGRAGVGAGKTTLNATGAEDVDTWVTSFDLHVLVGADVGPFRDAGVVPYALGGVGSLVTNPTGEGAGDLVTRSQTMWTWGGGVRARFAPRWGARAEVQSSGVRLADPVETEDRETRTIHNLRWEGSLQWTF